jgi:hypothetical protein
MAPAAANIIPLAALLAGSLTPERTRMVNIGSISR